MIKALTFAAAVTFAALAPLPAAAADKTIVVKFKSGKSSATLKGSITGYDGAAYVLDARAGQVISVLFSANRNACYFNFLEPGASSAIHRGEVDGNEFSATMQKSGKNRAVVYQMRSDARRGVKCSYSITFEISG